MTNSLPAQATHTNTSQSTVSLKTQAGSPKLDISESKTTTTTELLMAFTEIELTLAVVKAKFALIDSEEDDYILGGACQDSFSEGVKFCVLMNEFLDYARCSRENLKIQSIVNNIRSLISKMPEILQSEFWLGHDEMNCPYM